MRISKTHWLIIAAMAANMTHDLIHFILHPIAIGAVALMIRSVVCILVSIGIGWARVIYVTMAILTIFGEIIVLCSYYLMESKYGQIGSDPYKEYKDQITLFAILPIIHIILSIWTLRVLAFSEDVSEFFFRRKHR
jgi:hypothetical protein